MLISVFDVWRPSYLSSRQSVTVSHISPSSHLAIYMQCSRFSSQPCISPYQRIASAQHNTLHYYLHKGSSQPGTYGQNKSSRPPPKTIPSLLGTGLNCKADM